jgi:hypothetical protein
MTRRRGQLGPPASSETEDVVEGVVDFLGIEFTSVQRAFMRDNWVVVGRRRRPAVAKR